MNLTIWVSEDTRTVVIEDRHSTMLEQLTPDQADELAHELKERARYARDLP